jgi:ferritin-like protein
MVEREILEKHGIDMHVLMEKLRELLTYYYYYYTLIRYNLAGPDAESCADICDYAIRKYPVTYDYSLAILHEEVEHEEEELLGIARAGISGEGIPPSHRSSDT